MLASIVVATDAQNGIGFQNKLPWHYPTDLQWFKKLTTGGLIIMGRKTYESIGKPLPMRFNIVLSRSMLTPNQHRDQMYVAQSMAEALHIAHLRKQKEAFIIGGAEVYREGLIFAKKVYQTKIPKTYECDAYFPALSSDFAETSVDTIDPTNGLKVHTYQRGSYERV